MEPVFNYVLSTTNYALTFATVLPPQAVWVVSELVAFGCRHFFICPGSRNAPLVLALARHPEAKTYVAGDERAAGYMALGMAQELGEPVGVVVTSGTAALNLIPAAAEATLSQIPIILLTADRPPEWIGQQDGQAVFQQGAFGRHVKAAFDLPVAPAHADEQRFIIKAAGEAAYLSTLAPKGAVHINMPFREPFYPGEGEVFDYNRKSRFAFAHIAPQLSRGEKVPLLQAWAKAPRRIIVAGQMPYSADLRNAVKALLYYAPDVRLLADISSNLHSLTPEADAFSAGFDFVADKTAFSLDLVLHLGGSVTSRSWRRFLREQSEAEFWRLQPYAYPLPDPFGHMDKVIVSDETAFITELGQHSFFDADGRKELELPKAFTDAAAFAGAQLTRTKLLDSSAFSEVGAVDALIKALPEHAPLHIANSMPIRWVGWLGGVGETVRVWSNRGTSGIDGCTSTAVGAALATTHPVVLLTGETAFLYDRNGLWIGDALPPNLKIVALNNGGGTIFRLIDGPASLPERDVFFENRHARTAEPMAREASMAYTAVYGRDELEQAIEWLFAQPNAALVEVFTPPEAAEAVLKSWRNG